MPMMRSALAVAFAIAAMVSYLHLLADREVLALDMDPAKAIDMSLGYLSGAYPPQGPPGMGFLISVSSALGVPFRVFIALLTALVAFHSGYLLVRRAFGFPWAVGASAAASLFISLAPQIVSEGDVTWPHLTAGLIHLYLASIVAYGLFVKSRASLVAALIGTFLIAGFGAITRVDGLIVKVALLILVVVAAAIPVLRRQHLRRVVLMAAAGLGGMWSFEYGVTAFNRATYNVRGLAVYVDSRYMDFFSTVAALPSHAPTNRHFLADAPRRQLAYALSPTAMSLRDMLESRSGWCDIDFEFGRARFGVDDVPNSLFFWHVDRCMRTAGFGLGDYLERLGIAAREIRMEAARRGLKLKQLFAQALSPQLGIWLPYLPSSLQKVYAFSFPAAGYDYPVQETKSPDLVSAYDRATLRRKALLVDGRSTNAFLASLHPVYAAYVNVAYFAVPLFIVAVAFAAVRYREFNAATAAVTILALLLAGRLGFYGLLDAALYPAPRPYLLPNFVLGFFILTLGASCLVQCLTSSAELRPHARACDRQPSS
jgi:hypothetical protein